MANNNNSKFRVVGQLNIKDITGTGVPKFRVSNTPSGDNKFNLFDKKRSETLLSAQTVKNGKLTVDKNKIALANGFANATEMQTYKHKHPEIFEAMDGVKYIPPNSDLSKAPYATAYDSEYAKTLSNKAFHNMVEDFKNTDINYVQEIIDTLKTGEWQDKDTMKKYSNMFNKYTNSYIALSETGYLNHIPEKDRKSDIENLTATNSVLSDLKEYFARFSDKYDYKKKVTWLNMTWAQLQDERIKMTSAGENEGVTAIDELMSGYDQDNWDYFYNLRNASEKEQLETVRTIKVDAETYKKYLNWIKDKKEYIKSTANNSNPDYISHNEWYYNTYKTYNGAKEDFIGRSMEDTDEYIAFIKNWCKEKGLTSNMDKADWQQAVTEARKAYDIKKGYIENGVASRKQEKNTALLDWAESAAFYEIKYGSGDTLLKRYEPTLEFWNNTKDGESLSNYYNKMKEDSKASQHIEEGKKIYPKKNKYISDTEYEIACYYLGKGEKNNYYFKWLADVVNTREVASKKGWGAANNVELLNKHRLIADFTKQNPVTADLLSVGLNIGGGVEWTYNTLSGNVGTESKLAKAATGIREVRSDQIDWEIGRWDAFDFLYGAGMSALDSIVANALGGKAGSVILGLSAAAQATNDALERGMSNEKAFWNGFMSGVFEMFFEKYSIEQWHVLAQSSGAGFKTAIKNIGKSMITNASEETLTELANIAYDIVCNGDFSQYAMSIKKYTNMGLTEKEAKHKSALELGIGVAEAAGSGALMGLGFGSAGATSASYNATQYGKIHYGSSKNSIYALVNNGLAMPKGSTAYNLAVKADTRLKNGKSLSGTTLYNLADAIKSEIETKSKSRFQELGVDKKTANSLSPIVAKAVFGENLTQQEQETLNSNEIAAQVVKELSADRANTVWKDAIKNNILHSENNDNIINTIDDDYVDANAKTKDIIKTRQADVLSDISGESHKINNKLYENKALNELELTAVMNYKSSASYIINDVLRNSENLSDAETEFVRNMDDALLKMPTYQGTVYRNIAFDWFGGQEAYDAFLSEHKVHDFVTYLAYTSASTKVDGYLVDGHFSVSMVIESRNAKNVDGYGNNFESEVIFPRNSVFVVNNVEYSDKGQPIIYMTEVTDNDEGKYGQFYPKERSEAVQSLQKSISWKRKSKLQDISDDNTTRRLDRKNYLQRVSRKERGLDYFDHTITEKLGKDFEDEVESRFLELGVDKKAAKVLSPVVAKAVFGEQLTSQEHETLKNNKTAAQVVKELSADRANTVWKDAIKSSRINNVAENNAVTEQGDVLQSATDSVVDSDIILKYNDNSIKEGEMYAEDYQRTMGSFGREKREDDTRRTSGTTQENAETTREVGIAFQRRAKKTYGDAGRLVFHLNIAVAYKVADIIDNNSQAGIAYNILKSKGHNVVYCDGAFELNDGIKTIKVTEAITLSDGTIYISSEATLNGKGIALHEVVHILQYNNRKEYVEYEDVLCEEIDRTSGCYEKLAEEINDNHYGGKYNIEDISSFKYIIKELTAYISQYVCTNPKFARETFGGMFENWENVVQAVYKMNDKLGFDDVIKEATSQKQVASFSFAEQKAKGIDTDEFIKGLSDEKNKLVFSQEYIDELLESFGITKPGDYIHVQKCVMETLEREGYFTDKENRCTKVVNDASGMVVEINKKGIKETFNLDNYARLGRFKKFAKLAVVRSLPKMIKSGNIVLHDVPNKYDDLANNKKFTYIECLTKIEGKDTVVKFAIKQSPQKNNFWVHSIYTIENVSDSPASIDSNTEAGHITADENSLSQNYLNVNVNNNKHNNGIDADEFIKGLYGEDKEKAFEQGNVLRSTVDSVVDSEKDLNYNDNSIKEGEMYAEDYQRTMGSFGRDIREDDTRGKSENAEITKEDKISFERRIKRTYKNSGQLLVHLNVTVAFKKPKIINKNSPAGMAYDILKSKGYNVVYCDGPILINNNKYTVERTQAITIFDGTVYISSDSTLNGEGIALHEVVHVWQYANIENYLDYKDVLCEELILASEKYKEIAKEINDNHYNGRYDIEDVNSFEYIMRELTAYISQYVCTNPKFARETFGGMFENWENVVQAVYKMNDKLGFDDVIKEATSQTQVASFNFVTKKSNEIDADEFIKGLHGEDSNSLYEQGDVLQSTADSVVDSGSILKYNDNGIKEGEYSGIYQGQGLGSSDEETSGAVDSGKEARVGGVYGETAFAFRRRTKETYGKNGRTVSHLNITVAYKEANVINKNLPAGVAYNILKSNGYNVTYCDGPILINNNKYTVERTEAVTIFDGSIYISSDSTLNGEDIALHEVIHVWQYGNNAEYSNYESIVFREIDPTSEVYKKVASQINDNHYNGRYDIEDINSFEYIMRELTAYISQYVCTNPKFAREKFGGMFENWENVVQAVYKMNDKLVFNDVIKEATSQTQVASFDLGTKNSNKIDTDEFINGLYGEDTDSEVLLQSSTNAVTKPLSSYAPAKRGMIVDFLKSVDEKLKAFVERVKNGSDKFERFTISDVSDQEATDIKNLLGINVEGYTHNINTNGIKHILKRHGVNGQQNSSMSNDNDIARMGWVIKNYDNVEVLFEKGDVATSNEFKDMHNRPAAQIRYSKKINGTYYVVEAVFENNHNKLWVQSAYLSSKKEVVTPDPDAAQRPPMVTSETPPASPTSIDNISQSKNSVNDKYWGQKSDFEEDNMMAIIEAVYGNDVKFSIKAIIGNSGKNYGTGVYLDSNTLSTLNTEERVSKVKNYITHLGGRLFSAFDNYGKEVKIKIAPKSKYKNEKGNWERANRHLTNLIAKEEKQEAIILIDEIISTATFRGEESATHPHGWLDNNGKNKWEIWTTYIQDKEKTIWEATLNIANTTNGEKILYDIDPIRKVEEGIESPSTSTHKVEQAIESATSTTNNSITKNDDIVNINYSTKTDIFEGLEQEKQNNNSKFLLNRKVTKSIIDFNVVKVVKMNSVADLTGEEFKKGAVDLITQVEEYFNSIGNIVKSKYGDVELTRVGIKSSLGHGIGRKKAAAFKAVPNTIKYGEIINYQKNWKNRGYDTAIFAAPITINGKRHFLAVVINVEIDKNSYYLHEVALQEVESNTSFKTGTVKNGTPGDALPSIYNLLQKLQVVNNNYSTNVDMLDDKIRFSLKIKRADSTVEEIQDARNLTDEQAVEYLKQAKRGELFGHSYIPIRKDTPATIIDTLGAVGIEVQDCSLIMQVRKAQQAMSVTNNGSKSKKQGNNIRNHGMSAEQIVEIVNNLDNPTAMILQTNRYNQYGEELPDNVAVFVEYNANGKEGVAIVEFDSSIDPQFIGEEYGDTDYHTVVTIFEPDIERGGMPFDYIEELLSNPDNYELEIVRRQPTRSATQEKHPNTSSELPSSDIIFDELYNVNNNDSTKIDTFVGLEELNVREIADIENVCNRLGRKVVFEDLREMKYKGEIITPDGYIDANNVIHINTYAENPLGFVFKHELAHYAENLSGYNEFANTVKSSALYDQWIKTKTGEEYLWDAENTYRQMVYNSQNDFKSINDTRIDMEIIADFVGDMLFTDNGSGLLTIASESTSKQRNIIVRWVLKFIAYIKQVLGIKKTNLVLELSVLEDSFKCLLNGSEFNDVRHYIGDVQFCFVRCTDKQKIAAAEQMEKQGAKQYKIWEELKVIRNGWGDWLSEVNTNHFSFFAKGTASVERGRSNPNVRIEENIVEGKLGDFIGFKSLFSIYPQLKKVNVTIKYAATDYDTAKYLIDSNRLLINKKLYDAFVTKNDQTIKMHLMRELQRMIQVVEGRVIDSDLKNIERLRILGFPESRTEDRLLTENEIRNSFADEYEARVAERRQRARNRLRYQDKMLISDVENAVIFAPSFNYDDILLFDDNDKLITAKEYDVINENHKLDAYPSLVYDTKNDVTSLVSRADYVDIYPITPQDEDRLIEQGTAENSEKMPYYLTDLFYKKKTKRKKVDNRIRAGNSGCLENNGGTENKYQTVKDTLYHNSMIEASGSDTAGRTLSDSLTRRLNNNAFKDSNGNILSFYLWNNKPAKIERFVKLGKTFSTFDKVLGEFFESKNIEPFRYNGMFQEYYIDSVCPLVLEMSEWNTAAVAELLLKNGEISKNYFDELLKSKTAKKSEFNNASARSLTERIKLLGYDSVVLLNDSGCNIMVFDASQVIPVAQKGVICNSEINQLQENIQNEKEISSVKFLTINEEGKNSIDINETKNELSTCNNNTDKMVKLTEILTGVGNIEHPVLQQARVGSSGVLENTGGKRLEIYSKYKLLKTRATLPVSDYDTAGREVSSQTKLKNSNTIFKDNDGRLLSLFVFNGWFRQEGIGVRLGTLKSAREIYKAQKAQHPQLIDYQYQEYYVNMCNPYVWYHNASDPTPAKIANGLFAEGKMTFDEYSRLLATDGAKTTSPKSSAALYLKSTLLRHGYDGVICLDSTYDTGSITVFALKQEQLTPVTVNGDEVEKNDVEKNKNIFIDYSENKEYNKKKKKYLNRRPSYGKNQLIEVWNFAKKLGGGKVIDPTGKEITWDTSKPRNGQWDMGHIPGQKYSEMHKKYLNDEISEEEFVSWYRDPKNYRPELPSTNRSHKHE